MGTTHRVPDTEERDMDLIEVIKERKSIRAFKSDPVPR
jgi:hypothetical protein